MEVEVRGVGGEEGGEWGRGVEVVDLGFAMERLEEDVDEHGVDGLE